MVFIFTFTVFSVVFGQLLKVADLRKCPALSVSTVNYFVAALLLGIYQIGWGHLRSNPALIPVGLFGGVTFIMSFLALLRSFGQAGVGATLTAFRLSLVVPILVAVIFWQERPGPLQIIGILLVCLALCLLGAADQNRRNPQKLALLGILSVFFCEGMAKTASRMVHEYRLDDQMVAVLALIFFTACLIGMVVLTIKRVIPTRLDLTLGAMIGVLNILGTGSVVLALSQLPAFIVFPVGHMLCVALDNLCAWLIWKEALTGKKVCGVVLGIVAAGLLAMKVN